MSSAAVAANDPWQERLARRLDQQLEALHARDPLFLDRLQEQARQRAWHSLGLAPLQAELEALAAQRQELDERARGVHRALLAVVRRVPPEEVPASDDLPVEVTRAVQQRQAVHEEELLAADDRGRQILRLRRERANWRDTVWLAAAPAPVQALWQRVLALLGEEPTELQKALLAGPAAAND